MKGQIERRGDGVYRLRWYTGRVDGKRTYGSKTITGTKKQAEKALREVLAKQDRGFAVPSPAQIPTLPQYVETWKGGEAAARLRQRTLDGHFEILDRHVLPALGKVRLDAIHTARIESDVVAPLRKRGHLRSAALAVAALSKVFRSARKDPTLGLYGNPCLGVDIGCPPAESIDPLSPAERDRFRAAIRGTRHEAFWLLMMLTGLGPHEALPLGWEHLNFERSELRVARTLNCKSMVLVDDTKRPKRKRVVPIVPELRKVLLERWMAAGRPREGLVFPDENGGPLYLDNLRKRHFKPALKRAGIKRRFRVYDLRHGFATAALEAGIDVRVVSAFLGHSSTRITQDVYQHVTDGMRHDAAEKIAARLAAGACTQSGTQNDPTNLVSAGPDSGKVTSDRLIDRLEA